MPNPELERIAVFDVDGTLLRGDCLWLAARKSRGAVGQLLAALACLPWLIRGSWAGYPGEAIAAGNHPVALTTAGNSHK